jgi:2-polyprenyl-3-methyl-5-hydroxy-6-metoxy-1,4-benzoquinol methylase
MTSERTSEFFDSYAHDFNAIYGTGNSMLDRLINRFLRKSMMLRYRKSLEGCRPVEGKTVLDVGCGPGHYSIALARAGARRAVGIDFAPGMIDLARRQAADSGVEDRCEFICGDFLTQDFPDKFDHSILMGFMDYIEFPEEVIARTLALTSTSAFFSFPKAGGFLAWQRRVRYRRRCDLYLYRRSQVLELFQRFKPARLEIENIARDLFVTAWPS